GWIRENAGPCSFGLPAEYRQTRALAAQTVIDGRWKLILDQGTGIVELYDLEFDPGERHDCAVLHPTLVDRLRSILEKRTWVGTFDSRNYADHVIDDETMEQLKILGYAYSE
ncbi:hypothetical protein JXA80_04125, partial [bacterium]|nr:hypothetical protein [candidate division CSSED10-310 bacterium]